MMRRRFNRNAFVDLKDPLNTVITCFGLQEQPMSPIRQMSP